MYIGKYVKGAMAPEVGMVLIDGCLMNYINLY